MLERHVSDYSAAYHDGELSAAQRERFESHIGRCSRCGEDLEAIALGRTALRSLPVIPAPAGLWTVIETAADAHEWPQSGVEGLWRWAAAAALILIGTGAWWVSSRSAGGSWEVVATAGAPIAGSERLSGTRAVPTGQRIETDSRSQARIGIGAIGHVQVEPDTSVQLIAKGSKEHRLALHKGAIRASISAPPRLFFVETPAGTAIDLGCEYRLQCDRSGSGLLRVSAGWVALEWKGREALAPAGASCRLYAGRGPGVPWFDDASPVFRQALEGFDRGAADALPVLLDEARLRDTLTLWHMLTLVDSAPRVQVYERMTKLAPLPASLTREQVLRLHPESLRRWREELAWIW